MITEGQIRTAIAVLDAITDGELRSDDDTLLGQLESAIGAAYTTLVNEIECEVETGPDIDPPLTMSW